MRTKYYAAFFLLLASGFLLAYHFSSNQQARVPRTVIIPTATDTPVTAEANTADPPPPQKATSSIISAKSFISEIMDAEGNLKIIAEKNPGAKLPIASITKLMTAIVAVINYNLAEEIAVPEEASSTNGSLRKLKVGEIFFTGDLLYPLLIESDNDAGITLASKMGTGKFVELMNQKALDLGLLNTHYVNPTGLDPDDGSEPNYSTAEDIARLAGAILRNYPDILRMLSMKEFELKTASGTLHHVLKTTNKLLGESAPYTIIAGKTGETPKAKKNLVIIADPGGEQRYLVSVVLGSDDNFGDMKTLLKQIR